MIDFASFECYTVCFAGIVLIGVTLWRLEYRARLIEKERSTKKPH